MMRHHDVAGWMIGTVLAAMAAAQPVQWRVEDGGNGHWYYFSPSAERLLWPSARTLAEQRGGYLATISGLEEQLFIERMATTLRVYDDYWLGGFQPIDSPEPAGNWQWIDDTPWQFDRWGLIAHGSGSPPSPNDWNSAAPNEENYLEILFRVPAATPFGGWDDQGDFPNPWIIEWSADCNADGIVDKGQILSGQLPDANNNGIPEGGPTITSQPVDQNVGIDVPVAFIVEVAARPECTTPVTFQWQRRNPLVADPASSNAWVDLADGGGLVNTRGPILGILRPTPALATGYRCKMSGGCGGCEPGPAGFVYTNIVNFTVACPADFNADGGVDFGDIEAFFVRWEDGC
jgi:hypothetical protein